MTRPRFVRAEPVPGAALWYCDVKAVQVVTPAGRVLAWVSHWHGVGKTLAEAYDHYLTRQIAKELTLPAVVR